MFLLSIVAGTILLQMFSLLFLKAGARPRTQP
jgi:hypothetical protein